MSDKQYVKPPRDSVLKKAFGTMKGAYAYLHPAYRTRKLLQLIVVAPLVLFIDTFIYALCIMPHLPWEPSMIDTIIIIAITIISAYFYPFANWWYKQSITGTTLNNMVFIGSISGVMLRKMGTILFGVVLAGVLAPIIGPFALRKCKKNNMIIGEEGDF